MSAMPPTRPLEPADVELSKTVDAVVVSDPTARLGRIVAQDVAESGTNALARRCHACGALIEDRMREVVEDWAVITQPMSPDGSRPKPELVPSYGTVLDDTNYRQHLADTHGA